MADSELAIQQRPLGCRREPVTGTRGQRIVCSSEIAGIRYEYFVPAMLASLRVESEIEPTIALGNSQPSDARFSARAVLPLLAAADSFTEPTRWNDATLLKHRVRLAEGVGAVLHRFAGCRISSSILDEVHKFYFRSFPAMAGVRRDALTWVSGTNPSVARLVPPPTSAIPDLLQDYVDFCGRKDIGGWTKIALLHYQMLTIHPFRDGNGRLSRLLVGILAHSFSESEASAAIVPAVLCANKDYLRQLYSEVECGSTVRYFDVWRGILEIADQLSRFSGHSFGELLAELANRLGDTGQVDKVAALLMSRPAFGLAELQSTVAGSPKLAIRYVESMLSTDVISTTNPNPRTGDSLFVCPIAAEHWNRIDGLLRKMRPPNRA